MLYGCPALLIRELARRTGRGWPAILLLSAAAGLLQAGVIDQSLFAERYDEVRGWEETVRATSVGPFSAYMLQNFVLGHVVFSFCAPIALAEALRPAIAHRPWLKRRGMIVAAVLWLLVAGLIVADTSERATAGELAATLAAVAALIAAALHAPRPARRRPAPRVRTVLAVSFLLTAAQSAAPETWAGFAFALAVAAAGAALLTRWDWQLEHIAAIATGALLARGALAFTYYPVSARRRPRRSTRTTSSRWGSSPRRARTRSAAPGGAAQALARMQPAIERAHEREAIRPVLGVDRPRDRERDRAGARVDARRGVAQRVGEPPRGLAPAPGATSASSSPPMRARQSPARTPPEVCAATSRSTRSPVVWPKRSLICLKASMSASSSVKRFPRRCRRRARRTVPSRTRAGSRAR